MGGEASKKTSEKSSKKEQASREDSDISESGPSGISFAATYGLREKDLSKTIDDTVDDNDNENDNDNDAGKSEATLDDNNDNNSNNKTKSNPTISTATTASSSSKTLVVHRGTKVSSKSKSNISSSAESLGRSSAQTSLVKSKSSLKKSKRSKKGSPNAPKPAGGKIQAVTSFLGLANFFKSKSKETLDHGTVDVKSSGSSVKKTKRKSRKKHHEIDLSRLTKPRAPNLVIPDQNRCPGVNQIKKCIIKPVPDPNLYPDPPCGPQELPKKPRFKYKEYYGHAPGDQWTRAAADWSIWDQWTYLYARGNVDKCTKDEEEAFLPSKSKANPPPPAHKKNTTKSLKKTKKKMTNVDTDHDKNKNNTTKADAKTSTSNAISNSTSTAKSNPSPARSQESIAKVKSNPTTATVSDSQVKINETQTSDSGNKLPRVSKSILKSSTNTKLAVSSSDTLKLKSTNASTSVQSAPSRGMQKKPTSQQSIWKAKAKSINKVKF